jgi:hypothetical protein
MFFVTFPCCVVCVLSWPQINPCNSLLHPAVEAGIQPEGAEEVAVQTAYTPKSQCFGCGETQVLRLYLTLQQDSVWVSAVSQRCCAQAVLLDTSYVRHTGSSQQLQQLCAQVAVVSALRPILAVLLLVVLVVLQVPLTLMGCTYAASG